LAENNRTTFHYDEGESELVSGFSVEYGGGGFAIIFWRSMQVYFLKVYFFLLFSWAVIFILSFFLF
jgi:NADH-ubiquinone oxidoreductase chain 1